MEKSKIERINYLAKKSKETELSKEEKAEQEALRAEYRAGFKANFLSTLENTYTLDENGEKTKLLKKGGNK